MNPTRSPHAADDLPLLLQDTLQLLAGAQAFYTDAARATVDREVRDAFVFAAQAHAELFAALRQAQPAASAAVGAHYAAVASAFDGRRPQASARALQALEAELLRRMETLFRDYPDMRVRAALKRHVLDVSRAGDAMRRLALRTAA
ncbi:hypothetical protein ACFJIW_18150 [Tahibacter sp. UC22_41]|uniref:hypothetical protein n=1 Tax=Tahibacter sp. UC22_41 TaxID=3350178 RepID=UPI0036D88CE6